MTSSNTALLAGYAELDSAAVSDALDALELPPGQAGFLPVWGHPKIVGFAVTVQLEPYVPGPYGAHIGSAAVAAATDDNVIVARARDPGQRGRIVRQMGRHEVDRPRPRAVAADDAA